MKQPRSIGVIGAGAMGMGVVRSLLRCGFDTHVRDIRPDVMQRAAALGATCHHTAASLAAAVDIAFVLVVDAGQIDAVLEGSDGALHGLRRDAVVAIASTVDPDYVASLSARFAAAHALLVDAPVSGGPARAADGTMTMMVSGDAKILAHCMPVFTSVARNVFTVGARPGDAAKFKIINNLLAAVNLAAGAEALALAAKAGLDLRQVVDVVNASSGGSWIFADRMPRALDADYAPRAASRVLDKDVGIAVEFAARHAVDCPIGRAARDAFTATVAAGFGEEDDAAICKYQRLRAGLGDAL